MMCPKRGKNIIFRRGNKYGFWTRNIDSWFYSGGHYFLEDIASIGSV
jgi:hypothetical protein